MAEVSDEDQHKRLLQAVKDDDCDTIVTIIDTGYDVNTVDPEAKETPVIEACRSGSTQALELLIKKGGNPNHRSKSGRTPLHVCQEYKSIECIKILLQTLHIDLDIQDNFGATPLMLACHRGFREGVVLLLDHGCNMELKNQFGWTALHYCVTEFEKQIGHSKVACLEELVRRGANMNVRSKGGYNPLHTAVQMGHYDSVRVLVHENCATDIDAQAPMNSIDDTSLSCQGTASSNAQRGLAPSQQGKPSTEGNQSRQPVAGRQEVSPGRYNQSNSTVQTTKPTASVAGSVQSNPAVQTNQLIASNGSSVKAKPSVKPDGQISETPKVSAETSIQPKPSLQTRQPMKGRTVQGNPSGESTKAQQSLPMTPLAMALFFGHMAIVELLLRHDSTTAGLMEITTQVRRINPFLREALGLRSLKQLSRKSVRHALGPRITSKVDRLGLQASLTKFVLCEE